MVFYGQSATLRPMVTEATFTVPADQFPLGTVFQHLPDVSVTLERIIPAQDVIIPYFWVRGTIADEIETAFSAHPGVETIRLVDSVEDEYLLRVEWALEYAGILSTLAEADIPLLNAAGTKQQWTFETRGYRLPPHPDFVVELPPGSLR